MELLINNQKYVTTSGAETSLLEVLREELDLTGSKYGCGEGACGACTVLVDGVARRSCITKIASLADKSVITIEGISQPDKLHPVQKAFLKIDAFQCGYCAPGMVMSALALLKNNPKPSHEQVESAMQGNICRCGTYPRIVDAIKEASNV